jgi:hypothetical protein
VASAALYSVAIYYGHQGRFYLPRYASLCPKAACLQFLLLKQEVAGEKIPDEV